mmetsp:Transcript_25212/g.58725  ORF Transcript_25212/g.58725 Transcript_25212/m.58725 type:complete len:267 (+) Transcript_25212:968-1768(+)
MRSALKKRTRRTMRTARVKRKTRSIRITASLRKIDPFPSFAIAAAEESATSSRLAPTTSTSKTFQPQSSSLPRNFPKPSATIRRQSSTLNHTAESTVAASSHLGIVSGCTPRMLLRMATSEEKPMSAVLSMIAAPQMTSKYRCRTTRLMTWRKVHFNDHDDDVSCKSRLESRGQPWTAASESLSVILLRAATEMVSSSSLSGTSANEDRVRSPFSTWACSVADIPLQALARWCVGLSLDVELLRYKFGKARVWHFTASCHRELVLL